VSYQAVSASCTDAESSIVAITRDTVHDYFAKAAVQPCDDPAVNLPDTLEPYTGLSPKAYEHPADRAATAALKAVPMLDTVVRKLIEWQYERALRQVYLSNSVRAGERQLSGLWGHHVAVCQMLDMPRSYDLYVTDTVVASAMAIGSQNPIVVVGSPLLGRLGDGEQRALLGHEVGHILSDHMLYTTALAILARAGGAVPFPLGIPAMAVRAVLLEWSRAAQLSCDRAAALVVRDPEIVCRLLMAMAGGMPVDELNLDAFLNQAREYEDWDDPSDRVRRFFYEINRTHPYAVRRVSEVMRWVQSGEYDRIQRGEYIRRGEEPPVQKEAGDAFDFYAERFRTIFRDIGDNVAKVGNQIGGLAEQAADWLRTRSGRGGGGPSGGDETGGDE
jgi:Zn-dependent protease with chaperone function